MQGLRYADTQYFNPAQIGGLVLWLDATDPNANGVLPSNGASVSSWIDKSTQGNNFSQSTGANQPTFQTSIFGTLPAILGDGVQQYMSCSSSNSFPTGGDGRTLFSIVKTGTLNSTTLNYYLSIGQYLSTNAMDLVFDTRVSLTQNNLIIDWNGRNSGATTTTIADNTKYRNLLNFATGANVSNVTININDVNQTIFSYLSTTTPNTVTSTNYLFVRQDVNPASFYAGYLAEIIYYNVNLTASQISIVQNYLKNKWGV